MVFGRSALPVEGVPEGIRSLAEVGWERLAAA